VYKITYKTYLNDRLKEVDFHGKLTHPLYVQVTYERKTIFFKSYYFELFSKPRYLLVVPPLPPKGPTMEEVIGKEKEVIDFIIAKHEKDFSLETFKQAYAYYSKDLCDLTEKGFMDYVFNFLWDKGMPILGDIMKWGGKHVIAYDLVRDMKRALNKTLYDELVENSFHYAPPYLPLYGFMQQTKRWPMLCLTRKEWELAETKKAFTTYLAIYYPDMDTAKLVRLINNISS
jgi:hypothetical protein